MNVDLILPNSLGLLILFKMDSISAGEKLVGKSRTASMKLNDLIRQSEAEEDGVIFRSGRGANPMT